MDKRFGEQGGEHKEGTPERREIKMFLRCEIKRTPKGYVAVCLELSVASCGSTSEECENRIKEAIVAYIDVARKNQDSKIVLRRVPFYWFKRMAFDFHINCSIKQSQKKPKGFILEQMMPVGI